MNNILCGLPCGKNIFIFISFISINFEQNGEFHMEIIIWNQSSGNGSYRKAMDCLPCVFYNKTQTIKIMYKHGHMNSNPQYP